MYIQKVLCRRKCQGILRCPRSVALPPACSRLAFGILVTIAIASSAVPAVTPAQTIIVVRNPNLSSKPRNKNGHVDPTTFFADKQIPYATARLQSRFSRANHSPTSSVNGQYTSAQPSAAPTPCVAINCPTERLYPRQHETRTRDKGAGEGGNLAIRCPAMGEEQEEKGHGYVHDAVGEGAD